MRPERLLRLRLAVSQLVLDRRADGVGALLDEVADIEAEAALVASVDLRRLCWRVDGSLDEVLPALRRFAQTVGADAHGVDELGDLDDVVGAGGRAGAWVELRGDADLDAGWAVVAAPPADLVDLVDGTGAGARAVALLRAAGLERADEVRRSIGPTGATEVDVAPQAGADLAWVDARLVELAAPPLPPAVLVVLEALAGAPAALLVGWAGDDVVRAGARFEPASSSLLVALADAVGVTDVEALAAAQGVTGAPTPRSVEVGWLGDSLDVAATWAVAATS